MIKKILSLSLVLAGTNAAFTQVPEDAIRYSFQPVSGTARTMAIGGAMGSLGGDITSAYVNPAGIGLFRTKEFVATGHFNNPKSEFNFKNNNFKTDAGKTTIGPTGIIIGNVNGSRRDRNGAFSISINTTANFSSKSNFSGLNEQSSYAEQFAEEFAASGLSINQVLNSMSAYPYTAAPALYTYLIDTVTLNGQTIVRSAPEAILSAGEALNQSYSRETRGGMYELAVAYGGASGKWLYGGTLGIPISRFESYTMYSEADTSARTDNGFRDFTYRDNFTATGIGANLKLGVIYRPQDFVRLGLAVHTPSLMVFNESRSADLTTRLEPAQTEQSVSSLLFTNNQPGESRYAQTTPWKIIASAAYVFREVEDVTRQKGFITADIEYVTHGGSKFRSANEQPTADEKNYFKQLSNVINDQYNGAVNFRLGGELKFNTIMARLGAAYYSNPYADEQFKASMTNLSGGLGYRNKGFFVDLTYVYSMRKDGIYPYRLVGIVNNYATENTNAGNIIATVGLKF